VRDWGRSLTLAVCLAAAVSTIFVTPARAGDVARGICQPGLVEDWRDDGPALIDEFADTLGADVVRINFCWSDAELAPGVYESDYIGRAVSAIRAARARGMQVLVVVYETPSWASDRSVWGTAPPGDEAGVYHSYYPPSLGSLDELTAFMTHLSSLLRGEVLAYSCWVEPNLWAYLYPQRTASDASFGVRRYAAMLEAFFAGVRAGDPAAKVVAGETCPTGDDSRLRTSPQRFARRLAALGGARSFDVYAHHPYPTGGNAHIAPGALPDDTRHTVWLANLDTLLDVFPGKPFYLSEYAYPTVYSLLFGMSVSEPRQAEYLRAALRIAARHDQVEMLVWFPRSDYADNGTYRDAMGHYCGLVRLDGSRKRAYYVFAGGNKLTLGDLGAVSPGGLLTLQGTLTNARMGPLGGKQLVVLAHRPNRPWVEIARTTTWADGTYRIGLRPYASATWKVRWTGVVTSPRRWAPVR
jgi:hypothetical protein